MARKLVNFEMK